MTNIKAVLSSVVVAAIEMFALVVYVGTPQDPTVVLAAQAGAVCGFIGLSVCNYYLLTFAFNYHRAYNRSRVGRWLLNNTGVTSITIGLGLFLGLVGNAVAVSVLSKITTVNNGVTVAAMGVTCLAVTACAVTVAFLANKKLAH